MIAAAHHIARLISDQQIGEKGATLFWNTTMGAVIGALLGAVGVVVVLVSVVKGFTFIGQGKPGQAVKIAFGAIALCIFLFRPVTMNNVISQVADLFDNGLKTTKCIQDGVTNSKTPGAVPTSCDGDKPAGGGTGSNTPAASTPASSNP